MRRGGLVWPPLGCPVELHCVKAMARSDRVGAGLPVLFLVSLGIVKESLIELQWLNSASSRRSSFRRG
jgi:hypothetical protein